MWLHYALFSFIIISGLIASAYHPYKERKKLFQLCVFAVFFIIVSFRSYTVGNDTPEYLRVFNLIRMQPSLVQALSSTRFEPGYIILNYYVGKVTANYTVLLALIAFVYLFSSIWLVNRYAKSDVMAIQLMFCMSMLYLVINVERQCIAMAIFYFAIPFLEKRNRVVYCLIIFLACMFHIMSIILFSLAFLPNINFSDRKQMQKWIILSFLSLFIIQFGVTRVAIYFPYFQHYLSDSIYSQGGIRSASLAFFAVRILIIVLVGAIGGYNYQHDDNNTQTLVFNKLLFMDIIFATASIGFNMYDRIENFFTLPFIICIVNALKSLDYSEVETSRNNKSIAFVLIIALTFAYMTATLILRSDWTGIFPYSFIKGEII